MEFFKDAYSVRLLGPKGKYLWAAEDKKSVAQKKGRESYGTVWRVELEPGRNAIRLKSQYDMYLNASDYAFLLGATGKKVTQSYAAKADSSLEWQPVSAGKGVKLRTKGDKFLRANGGMRPYRNSVTHDVPVLASNQHVVLWEVEVVRHKDAPSLPPSRSPTPRQSNATQSEAPPPRQPQVESSDEDQSSVPPAFVPRPPARRNTTVEIPPTTAYCSPSEASSPEASPLPHRRTPPAREASDSPPPRRRTPPAREASDSPPPRRRTPPAREASDSPPPRRRTPPARQASESPPPYRRAPPAREASDSPPPRRRTPPAREASESPPPYRRAPPARQAYESSLPRRRASPPPRETSFNSPPHRRAAPPSESVRNPRPRRRASPPRAASDSPPSGRRASPLRESPPPRGRAPPPSNDDYYSPDSKKSPPRSRVRPFANDEEKEGSSRARPSPRAQKLNSPDVRQIYYSVADEDGEVDKGTSGDFLFKGSTLQELTEQLQRVTGINDDILLCMRNTQSTKLYKMRLALPPNKAPMSIVVVRQNSHFGRSFSIQPAARQR